MPFSGTPGGAPDVPPVGPDDPVSPPLLRGLVALGDSITVGEGEPLQGVVMQSWAQWTAEAFDLPFHKLARNGALAHEILRDLAPRMRGGYDIACVYAGVNDVRSEPWDPDAYRRTMNDLLVRAGDHAARVVVCTLPTDLGRPSSAPKPEAASAIVRELAVARGALVVELDDLGGRRLVLPDVVHPTALGQVEMAARAVRVLAGDGLRPRTDPWDAADPYTSLRARLASERRWARGMARDLRRRGIEAAQRRLRG
ncbi:GDSL-type esterase/lipase family protein [Patulibacter sp. SYSU D01012]|uniref:SGNH/GDSL hydrolase family protein n=1 Tax=Patulibacter sp. SYSU D01012 TaxID=2817381 RepID=UPI001B317D21|nr:GDSL-type esterase/lipase family protein [Patulibacter sp. SYSU D01012]